MLTFGCLIKKKKAKKEMSPIFYCFVCQTENGKSNRVHCFVLWDGVGSLMHTENLHIMNSIHAAWHNVVWVVFCSYFELDQCFCLIDEKIYANHKFLFLALFLFCFAVFFLLPTHNWITVSTSHCCIATHSIFVKMAVRSWPILLCSAIFQHYLTSK